MPRGGGGGGVGSLWRCLSPSWRRWSLWLFRRLGGAMTQAEGTPGLRYGLLLGLLAVGCLLLSPLFLLLVGEGECGSSSLAGPVVPPPPGGLSAGQMVRWLESQGDSANASAGIVGNLEQESQLNPTDAGGGLAQWKPGRYGQMVAYTASVGLSPTSDQGQLVFLQYDLRTSYNSLLSRMDTAPDPGAAAEMFETTYELCQGVVGYMDVIAGSRCEDANRKLYAVRALAEAGGVSATTGAVSLAVLGDGCAQAAGFGSGKDPIPSPPWEQGRDDMGVDASAPIGAPIKAPAGSTLVEVLPWFPGPCGMQPLLLLRFTQEQPGTEDGDQYWYVAEQITPVTQTIGTTFAPGQPVAHFAACGTGIEIGWGSPTSTQRTLAGQMGDGAAANPAAGSLTPWAESFKRWCQMPASWLGTSP